ncbi:B-cell linker protein [Latimeria chalumnae]|uniref:B-cell linker protein n=1 Tax=Latimeria chalumnae TaxID=7897 RepID=UPI00313CDA3E
MQSLENTFRSSDEKYLPTKKGKESPSPPTNRKNMIRPPKPSPISKVALVPRNSPKLPNTSEDKRNTLSSRKPPPPKSEEQNSEEEYEVCDPSCSVSDTNKSCQELPLPATPVPLSRPGFNTPLLKPKPGLPPKPEDKPAIPDRHKISNKVPELPPPIPASINLITHFPTSTSANQHEPPELPTRPTGTLRNAISSSSSNADKEAGVYNKAWYASFCDRKTAEEALQKSHKDGSFLIRKSSGQDSKQPYTLAVFYKKRVYNIPVRYIESTKQYALGREKNGEERFHSVAEIIENHQQNPLVLIDSQNNTKDSTKLKYAVQVS